jgi:outer membrane protein
LITVWNHPVVAEDPVGDNGFSKSGFAGLSGLNADGYLDGAPDSAEASTAESHPTWSLESAQEQALVFHPSLTIAQLQNLVATEELTRSRARFFPSLTALGSVAAAGSDNTRLYAGGINNPIVFSRGAVGLVVTQLITDFGRTARLVASSKARRRAAEMEAELVGLELKFQVGQAYLGVLEAEAVRRAADQAVEARGLLVTQVSKLAAQELKSELDVAFAEVTAREADLLALQAVNDLQAAHVRLTALTGEPEVGRYLLVEPNLQVELPQEAGGLVVRALEQNPELKQLRALALAAGAISKAEQARRRPTISAIGAVGWVPMGESRVPPMEDDYAAGAVTLSLPLFAGRELAAASRSAQFQADQAGQSLEEAEIRVIESVRVAQLTMENARRRRELTSSMVSTAQQALRLARLRYQAGTSSMVELSQAEMTFTAAEIEHAQARLEVLRQQLRLRRLVGDFKN